MFSFWVRHLFEGGELLKTVDYFLVDKFTCVILNSATTNWWEKQVMQKAAPKLVSCKDWVGHKR